MSETKSKIISTVSSASYECTVTVDCAVFGFQDDVLKLMLVRRSIEPFKDFWMLPGGIMEEGQSLEEASKTVLFNLTGIQNIHIEQVKSYSGLNRHPVKRVVTVCFYALVKPENHILTPHNYVSDIQWFNISDLPTLGFDHNELALDSLKKLRRNLVEELIFGELLPNKFTLTELQQLYESILGEKLDKRNFRKKMQQMDLLKPTGEKKKGVKGGPDLYRIKTK